MSRLDEAPVYVGGLDRSGKTTMSAFLASHPDICIPGVGSNMWTYFAHRYGGLSDARNLERCLDAMLRYKHVRYLEPDEARIRAEFAAGEATYARLFALFLRHYAERRGKPRWGAQTGLIERYADELFATYPGLRIVHMVRDPRDRYEASLAAWPDGRGRAGGATARWRYSTTLGRRHERAYPDRYRLVRFEDLVTDPVGTVQAVCRFLDAPYVPSMLTMSAAPTLRAKLGGDEATAPVDLLSSDHVGRYRGRLRRAELAFIQQHTGELMRTYGYTVEDVAFRPAERARYVLVDYTDQFVRAAAWRSIEELQQRFPRVIPRRPGARMRVERVGTPPEVVATAPGGARP